jgi:hypothetical protein
MDSESFEATLIVDLKFEGQVEVNQVEKETGIPGKKSKTRYSSCSERKPMTKEKQIRSGLLEAAQQQI